MFGLFAKKCEYCKLKIEKGKGVEKDIRVPGSAGTKPKIFCSEEHAGMYEQELKEYTKSSGGSGKSCCG